MNEDPSEVSDAGRPSRSPVFSRAEGDMMGSPSTGPLSTEPTARQAAGLAALGLPTAETTRAESVDGPADTSSSTPEDRSAFKRALPDRSIVIESNLLKPLQELLESTVRSIEGELAKFDTPYSLKLVSRTDPEEPDWLQRDVRIRVPRMSRADRNDIWNTVIDNFQASANSRIASLRSARERKRFKRVVNSIFIEMEMA